MSKWGTVPLRYVANVIVSNVDKKSVPGEPQVRLVNYTDVYYGDVITPELEFMVATATPEQARRFAVAAGDTIITKDSETPEDIAISAYIGRAESDMVCGYHLAMVRPVNKVDPRFIFWAMNAQGTREQAGINANGMTRYGISLGAIRSLNVPLPHLDVQRRIADFLDDQTTRIDNIIKARQQQIVLLQDQRDAEWATLVRELDEAFDVVPIRRVVASITDGPFGSSLTSSHYADSGIRVVRLGNIGLNSFRDEDKAYISNEYGRSLHRYSVAPGDVLMAGLGDEKWPLGRCAMAPSELGDAIVKADCYRLRLTTQLQARYFAWYLSSPDARHRFIDLARGATRARLNTDIAMSATIAVPPIQVQNEALREFEKSATLIGQVENALRESIGYLQELKRSLITSAVTGEFDVSTADGSGVGV